MTDAGPLGELAAALRAAVDGVRGTSETPASAPTLDRPRHKGLGDYSTNAAMLLAPVLGAPPREIASRLADEVGGLLGEDLERVEVAGPGFLNLVLTDDWHRRALRWVLDAGERFGAGGAERPERVLIEFVSANPTGPLVAASGRHAAYGDALARILAHHGHSVDREYYFNDAGNQIRLLGESVQARARGEEVPEGGYQGDYVAELASSISGAANGDVDSVARRAVDVLLAQIKATLERYGVHFDLFFSEQTLHSGSPSALQRALEVLEQSGHVYRSEGALWLRTTDFGDDKDRVVVRSNGQPTYLAADIAYMQNKRDRGFELQLVPVGSDHAAYVREMKAAMAALGGDPDTVELPLLQFVHLVEGGAVFAMSKRRGDFVRLDDLIDAIGVDATRFFMLRSSNDRTIELDVELARKQSRENPVYYVQYAHARIASMLRKLDPGRVSEALAADWISPSPLEDLERDLIKKVLAFPGEVAEAAERRAPHRITGYALELAQDFTAFYEHCRVIGVTPAAVESQRVALSAATQRTIALALGLLGVSAPDSM
ncbi:MAG TPA: arginine--tRNA ligase [Solirubrobacteraceae bacterium]|nr:arginine--tRNA ligase [Solirubrobacteraceae bacterium]